MHGTWKLLSILTLFTLPSCFVIHHKNDGIPTGEYQLASKGDSSKLIFINFKITKDSLKENSSVDISKIQFTDGCLKKPNLADIYKPTYQNKLRCVFEDNNGKNIYETIIEHPLFRQYEYAMDDGSMGVKNIVLNESTFSIRTDFTNDMMLVRIYETLSAGEEKEIVTFEIKK